MIYQIKGHKKGDVLFSLIKQALVGSILLSCVCPIKTDSKTTSNLQFVLYYCLAPVKMCVKNTVN